MNTAPWARFRIWCTPKISVKPRAKSAYSAPDHERVQELLGNHGAVRRARRFLREAAG